MKKVLLAVVSLLFVVTLAACRGEADITPPVISGVEEVTIFMNSDFDPLAGVTAIDDVDGDITDDIVVTGVVNVEQTGTYFLRYVVEDSAGNRTERTRFVNVVVDPDLAGDDMVANGNFDLGTAFWQWTVGIDGGAADFTVVNGEMNAVINGVTAQMWGPRLESVGITFEQGGNYRVRFDARALAPRALHVQVGELIDRAPWFVDFKPGQVEIFELTTEMQTFEFVFPMSRETNENGALLFEMGTIAMSDGTNGTPLTTIIFDNVSIEPVTDFEDTIAPIFSGVGNSTIDLGVPFDALEGVSAFDNVDGDVTEDITVAGEVDVNALGEYTLTYTVSDAAGNIATATRVITVAEAAGEPGVRAADFGWRTFLNDWEGTAGSLSANAGRLTLNLSNINASQNWQIQIIQDAFALGTGEDNVGSILFESGKTYRVTFEASASVAGDAVLAIGHAGGGWTPYFVETFAVTEEAQLFTFEFTLDDAEADYTVPAQFKLEMGLLFAGEETGSFTLANVAIDIDEAGEFVDTDFIVNGNFTAIREANYGWRTFLNDWDGTAGNLSVDLGELSLNLSNINTGENWQIQIIQDAFALGTGEDNQGSLHLEEGKTYRVSFYAKASVAGNVTLAIGHAGGGWTPYFVETFAVTEEFQLFTFEFTLDDAEADYSVPAQFKLEMGLLFAGEETGSFTLADVAIDIEEAGAFVETNLIVNGTFSEVILPSGEAIGWRTFLNDWEGTSGNLAIVNGRLVLDLAAVNANQNWHVQVIQDAFALGTGEDNVGSINFTAGNTYRVTFDARASVAGDITLAIGHAGGGWTPYFMETIAITRNWSTYTVTFTLDDAEADYSVPAQFKLEMGLLFAGSTRGQFALDNVIIEVEVDGAFVDAEAIVNGDFNTVE